MIYKKGDVVVVPFPFTDINIQKNRPALVLSPKIFNDKNQHTILAMITTGANSSWPDDLRLEDLKTTGLKHASIIRPKIFTLDNRLIVEKIGTLGSKDLKKLDQINQCYV